MGKWQETDQSWPNFRRVGQKGVTLGILEVLVVQPKMCLKDRERTLETEIQEVDNDVVASLTASSFNPGVAFTGEGKEHDTSIIRAHPLIPLLEEMNYHPGLPTQRHCPRPPSNVPQSCQPRLSLHIYRLEEV